MALRTEGRESCQSLQAGFCIPGTVCPCSLHGKADISLNSGLSKLHWGTCSCRSLHWKSCGMSSDLNQFDSQKCCHWCFVRGQYLLVCHLVCSFTVSISRRFLYPLLGIPSCRPNAITSTPLPWLCEPAMTTEGRVASAAYHQIGFASVQLFLGFI